MRWRAAFVLLLLAATAPAWPAAAQSTPAGSDVIDPWRASSRQRQPRMLDLEDPWADQSPITRTTASGLVDPWKAKRATKTRSSLESRKPELTDPWGQDAPVPTAAFPLLDPWQRAPAESQRAVAPQKPSIPTAAFPVLEVVNPWSREH